jgi:hypothetical protein
VVGKPVAMEAADLMKAENEASDTVSRPLRPASWDRGNAYPLRRRRDFSRDFACIKHWCLGTNRFLERHPPLGHWLNDLLC